VDPSLMKIEGEPRQTGKLQPTGTIKTIRPLSHYVIYETSASSVRMHGYIARKKIIVKTKVA